MLRSIVSAVPLPNLLQVCLTLKAEKVVRGQAVQVAAQTAMLFSTLYYFMISEKFESLMTVPSRAGIPSNK